MRLSDVMIYGLTGVVSSDSEKGKFYPRLHYIIGWWLFTKPRHSTVVCVMFDHRVFTLDQGVLNRGEIYILGIQGGNESV